MNFAPTTEQRDWEERARRLAREALGPRAAAMDARGDFPRENFADLRREGFLRLAVPSWYGGLWVDHVTYALAMIALGTGCASTTCCLAMHFGCVFHILAAGSREQKARMMEWVVRDEALFAIAGTDAVPDASSPPGVVLARRVPGGFRLTGRKYFVTAAGGADAYVVRAHLEGDPPGAPAPIFVVPAGPRDDLRIHERWDGMGLRASATNDLMFEETWVPEIDMLGVCAEPEPLCFQPTAGFSIGLSAWPLGTAIAALEYTLSELGGSNSPPRVGEGQGERLTSREGSGESLRTREKPGERSGTEGRGSSELNPAVPPRPLSGERRRLLAEMKMKIDAARWMLLYAAWVADTDPDHYLAPLQEARFTCTANAVDVTRHALLAAGGRGYLGRNPLERLLRDALAGPLQAACHETCPDRVAEYLIRSHHGDKK